MDAYYVSYTNLEPVNEFLRNGDLKASIAIFRELLSPSGSELQNVREMTTFFGDMQRLERRKDGSVFRRSADNEKLICSQRNGIARLLRAGRQD